MQIIGVLMLLLGLLGVVVALSLDTTVATANGLERIHNLGLMSQQQNLLVAAGLVALIGAVLFAMARRKSSISAPPTSMSDDRMPCPRCAERIMRGALVCRFCGTELSPKASGKAPPADAEVMHEFGITHEAGAYHFGGFKYDKLSDAVAYARLHRAAERRSAS